MAKHDPDFEKAEQLKLILNPAGVADAYSDRPRTDLLIRFLSGEEIDEELDGAFASISREFCAGKE
ncbi:hypothetical protein WJS89_09775 [Sphingomicrobium sp. XHP0235]|uniref:hypothetical protein n=1 Tax=Sphingomicrobium aquimarinum TaxID=3133971 RepID=UPI0031FEAAC8